MRKVLKTITVSMLSIMMLLVITTPIGAMEKNDVYEVVINNDVYEFKSETDYNNYLLYLENKTDKARTGIEYVTTPIFQDTVEKEWVGYHPEFPDWGMRSSYTLSASRSYTIGGSAKYKDFTFTFSVTDSSTAASTYPADATRYSKLGDRKSVV